jgi:hypothetical protein
LKILICLSIVVIMASEPAFCESVFDNVLPGGEARPVGLRLSGETGVSGGGYAASLVAGGLSMQQNAMQPSSDLRSPLKEGAASFLLPGLGQYRMGRTIRSRIYFALEGAAWIAIGSFLWQGHAREVAYKDYAVAYADVQGTDHPDDYWEKIGQFRSNEGTYGYNESVMREARDLYYPDRAQMDAYYEQNKITGDLGWQWNTERTFDLYNALRDGSRAANRRALYTVMFAFTLRIVSMVDAVMLARGENQEPAGGEGKISFNIEPQQGGFLLSFKRSF